VTERMHKVVLTDDHRYVSESLKIFIDERYGRRLDVCAMAEDGQAAIDAVKRHKPDIIVLDIQMPRLDGISAIKEIKKAHPPIIVLVFSAYEDRPHILQAIGAGADDYLLKRNSTPAKVVDHIFRALAKALPSQDEIHRQLLDALRELRCKDLPLTESELTGTELEVLKLAAYKGASAKMIARELGQGRMSIRTVATHWQHILDKLGAVSQAQAVCMAIKQGLISSDPVEPTRE
jgi:DNA-binding NarL/FixJ family response regulator